MEGLGKFVAFIVILALTAIITGFVLSKLWAWFIIPSFGLNELNLVQCIGLSLTIAYLRIRMDDNPNENLKKNFSKELAKVFVFAVTSACFVLLVGWVISLFM